jgi:MFS family permease
MRVPGLRGYLLALAVFSLGNASDAFLLLRAGDLGVPNALLPLLWTSFHVVKVASTWIGGAWADRADRVKSIAAGWAVYAATYLAFGVATQPWHAWALMSLYAVYHGLTEPAEKALVRDLAPAAMRGRAYGLYNFVLGASAIPAGLLTGWLWQTFGPRTALTTGAALAAIAAAALLRWSRRSRRSPHPDAAES